MYIFNNISFMTNIYIDTITRDTFPLKKIFSLSFIFNVLIGIASACIHLHQRKYRSIMHGDLYAHNILVQSDGTPLLTGNFFVNT